MEGLICLYPNLNPMVEANEFLFTLAFSGFCFSIMSFLPCIWANSLAKACNSSSFSFLQACAFSAVPKVVVFAHALLHVLAALKV